MAKIRKKTSDSETDQVFRNFSDRKQKEIEQLIRTGEEKRNECNKAEKICSFDDTLQLTIQNHFHRKLNQFLFFNSQFVRVDGELILKRNRGLFQVPGSVDVNTKVELEGKQATKEGFVFSEIEKIESLNLNLLSPEIKGRVNAYYIFLRRIAEEVETITMNSDYKKLEDGALFENYLNNAPPGFVEKLKERYSNAQAKTHALMLRGLIDCGFLNKSSIEAGQQSAIYRALKHTFQIKYTRGGLNKALGQIAEFSDPVTICKNDLLALAKG